MNNIGITEFYYLHILVVSIAGVFGPEVFKFGGQILGLQVEFLDVFYGLLLIGSIPGTV